MTVCIAVTPRFSDEIILVSDQLLSSTDTSVDGQVVKFTTIAPGVEWYVMYAGDPSRFKLLMDGVREALGDVRNTRFEASSVITAIDAAYSVELRRLIEREVLSPFGLSRDDFLKKGKDYFGEGRFQELIDQIARIDLGLELLVAGLDPTAQTHLFSVSPRGIVVPAALPYHAIGSGAFAALGTLYQLARFPTGPHISEVIYRACAAKIRRRKRAERRACNVRDGHIAALWNLDDDHRCRSATRSLED